MTDIKKTWRIVKSGEGYQDIRWMPVFCGGLGYRENGGAFCFVDLVFFRRIYFRVIELEAAPFEFMLHSKRAIRIGEEMRAAIPPGLNVTSIELCVKMMQHSVFAERTQELRPSEVKEALKFFFTDEEIKQANDIICGRA